MAIKLETSISIQEITFEFIGGPLFITENGNFVQVGIVSYGRGCAAEFPGVYTKVESYSNWISNIIGEDLGNGVSSLTFAMIHLGIMLTFPFIM